MINDLVVAGLMFTQLGMAIVLLFQPASTDELFDPGKTTLLGSSTGANLLHDSLWPRFGVLFPTMAISEAEQRVITRRGERLFTRLGWWVVFVGGAMQIVGQW